MVGCKIKTQWQKGGIYMIKYKDKWERMGRKGEREAETNLHVK
jgi:ribosomal protein L21